MPFLARTSSGMPATCGAMSVANFRRMEQSNASKASGLVLPFTKSLAAALVTLSAEPRNS